MFLQLKEPIYYQIPSKMSVILYNIVDKWITFSIVLLTTLGKI